MCPELYCDSLSCKSSKLGGLEEGKVVGKRERWILREEKLSMGQNKFPGEAWGRTNGRGRHWGRKSDWSGIGEGQEARIGIGVDAEHTKSSNGITAEHRH